MTSWRQVKEVFAEAVERDGPEREAYLRETCGPDANLRAEVDRLLAEHDEHDDLLDNAALSARWLSAPEPEAHVFDVGETLAGRFEIVRFIGRGGMGEVYEANDLELGDHVAIKTVLPEFTADPTGLRRFKREIQLARKVTHPNVCRIFDVAHHERDGREYTFLSMELLEGETLSEHLKTKGRLTTDEALPLVRQMAAGLDALHQAGIVHRDFKPANVILTEDSSGGRRAVITDFGLARNVLKQSEENTAFSRSGQILGTPSYMAPEQFSGGEVGPWTDVYALGLILFEVVTGEKAFEAETPLAQAYQKAHGQPRGPTEVDPTIAPAWDKALRKCLMGSAADRASLGSILELSAPVRVDGTAKTSRTGEAHPADGQEPGQNSISVSEQRPGQIGRRSLLFVGGGAAATAWWWVSGDQTLRQEFFNSGERSLDEAKVVEGGNFLGEAVNRDERSALARIELGLSLLVRGQYRRGHKEGEEAYRLVTEHPDQYTVWDRYWVQARYCQMRRDYAKAREHFRALADFAEAEAKARWRDQNSYRVQAARAHEKLALIFSYQNSPEAALREIDKALDLHPDSLRYHGFKSVLLVEASRPIDALQASEVAQRKEPSNSYPSFGRGLALLYQGEVEEARRAFAHFGGTADVAGGAGSVDRDVLFVTWSRLFGVQADVLDGRWEQASESLKRHLQVDLDEENYEYAPRRRIWIAELASALGRQDDVRYQLEQLSREPSMDPSEPRAVPQNVVRFRDGALVAIDQGEPDLGVRFQDLLHEVVQAYPSIDGQPSPPFRFLSEMYAT